MAIKTIVNTIGWIILLLAFGSLGFTSDDPSVGVPVFTIFFLIIFGLVYLYVRKHQKRTEIDQKAIMAIHKIFGILLVILALFSPIIALRKINLPFIYNLIIFIGTAILIGLAMLAVSLINNQKTNNFISSLLGYLLLIIVSGIPAIVATNFLMIYFPNAYNSLGTSYWSALAVAVFAWWGFSLYSKKVTE